LVNYYSMVEKEYVDSVIKYNNEKFHTDVMKSMSEDLNQ